jgi:hypothetical protein
MPTPATDNKQYKLVVFAIERAIVLTTRAVISVVKSESKYYIYG